MFPLPCLCCLTYALQRLGHAFPHLSAVRALLVRVPLGPRPWLHPLRSRSPGLVRRLHRYYGGVRLLGLVHHRLWLLAFPARTDNLPPVKPKISRFPNKERTCMPGSPTAPDQTGTCVSASAHGAFHLHDGVGIRDFVSFAAQWLAYTLPCQRFTVVLTGDSA